MTGRKVTGKCVKRNVGHPENERVDALAKGETRMALVKG